MLGALIRRFRQERGLTQAEMAGLLSEHGWKLGGTYVSRLEGDAANNRNGNYRVEQIEAVASATGYDRWVCYFWAGRIPLDPRALPDERLRDHFIKVGMGLLYAAVGAIDLGPDISYDLAARTGLLGNDPEFLAKAEIEALRARG